jgi:hypothetical protein
MMLTAIYGCDSYGPYSSSPHFDSEYWTSKEFEAPYSSKLSSSKEVEVSEEEKRYDLPVQSDDLFGLRLLKGHSSSTGDGGVGRGGHIVSDAPCVASEGGITAFFFFFVYVTFSALILLSILLGVIQAGMDEARERQEMREERKRQVKAFTKKYM